jgi:maltose alpha-D-glucosyltransferase/alpha-amylase
VRHGPKVGALYDAMSAPEFPLAAIEAMRAGTRLQSSAGEIRFWSTSALEPIELAADAEIKPLGVEQSNSSVRLGEQIIFKAYRRLAPGIQPELEIGRFLVEEAKFANTPPLLGGIERRAPDGQSTAYGSAFGFVRNQGDGWVYTTEYLDRRLGELRLQPPTEGEAEVGFSDDDAHGFYLTQARILGQRTAELHRAFAVRTKDAAFKAEPITLADLNAWGEAVQRQAEAAFGAVEQAVGGLEHEQDRAEADLFLAWRALCLERIGQLVAEPVAAAKTRLHGDYHLGQVLVVQNDFYILDFEGEPARPLGERRIKLSPLKDVAGMLRSFDYAAWSAYMRLIEIDPSHEALVLRLTGQWREATEAAFLAAYRETIEGCPSYPAKADEADRLLELFLLEKALYEICYEAANRPSWLRIPLKGVLNLLNGHDQTGADDGTG